MRRVASTPSMTGIERSMTITSGFSSSAFSAASAPFFASPTARPSQRRDGARPSQRRPRACGERSRARRGEERPYRGRSTRGRARPFGARRRLRLRSRQAPRVYIVLVCARKPTLGRHERSFGVGDRSNRRKQCEEDGRKYFHVRTAMIFKSERSQSRRSSIDSEFCATPE